MKAWHFVNNDRRLGYGDDRLVKAGRIYRVSDNFPLKLCNYGLHGSRQIIDALKYAPGSILCRVQLIGERIDDNDKSAAYIRRVGWTLDVTDILWRFARLCALDVAYLWDAPAVVIKYLRTGDESLRDAAQDAAWDAAQNAAAQDAAAQDAAHDAAQDATCGATQICSIPNRFYKSKWQYTAQDAAEDAIWAAGWATAWTGAWATSWTCARDAAWAATRAATWTDVRKKQNRQLTSLVIAARRMG